MALVATPPLTHAQQTRQAQSKAEDTDYDRIVEDFIQFDIGNVRDPAAVARIKARFNGLKSDEAVPALVAGLNRSTRMRASCPITALSSKLKGILRDSQDAEIGAHVLRNLDLRDSGGYTHHIRGVYDAAEKQLIRLKTGAGAEKHFKQRFEADGRLAHAPGMKLTELTARDGNTTPQKTAPAEEKNGAEKSRFASPRVPERRPSASSNGGELSKLNIEELADQLKAKDKAMQGRAIGELYRRASDGDERAVAEHAETIAKAVKDGDDPTRETAARLLGLIRHQPAVLTLIDALEDPKAPVRSSAATALARITRQLFGPSDNATPEERAMAVARWREWWTKQGKSAAR
jgi:hypothetical protein